MVASRISKIAREGRGADIMLKIELAAIRAEVVSLEPVLWGRYLRQIGQLIAADTVGGALRAGEMAPDFSLPATTDGVVSLDSLLARGPAVVAFFRGGWCPFCRAALKALDSIQPDLARRGAALVGIAPEPEDRAIELTTQLALRFPLLIDRELHAARLYGIAHDLRPDLAEALERAGVDRSCLVGAWGVKLPLPAAYVIGRDGIVAWAFVDPDFTRRAEPRDVLAAVERLVGAASTPLVTEAR